MDLGWEGQIVQVLVTTGYYNANYEDFVTARANHLKQMQENHGSAAASALAGDSESLAWKKIR